MKQLTSERLKQRFKTDGIPVLLRRLGVAPAPRSRFLMGQRDVLMRGLALTHVLDVGANDGQYARELRAMGFDGAIDSFEPAGPAFERLDGAAAADPLWQAHRLALGAEAGHAELQTWDGSRDQSASLRRPTQALLEKFGEGHLEVVTVARLDDWLEGHPRVDANRSLLKLDVQGFESEVLRGAVKALEVVPMIEIEAPLQDWYEGQASLVQLMSLLGGAGYVPATIATERFHPDWLGAVDVDVLFIRRGLSKVPA
jgi:FkbM family methyltransferase